jgi:hypothetical protein
MKLPSSGESARTQTTPVSNSSTKAKPAPPPSQRTQVRVKGSPSRAAAKMRVPRPKPGVPRPDSKTARVLALLKRPQGAGLKELQSVTGWQPHSVRGFLSGVVAKKMRLKVRSFKTESGERRYAVKP